MKLLSLTICGLVCLSAAAWAQNGPGQAYSTSSWRAQAHASEWAGSGAPSKIFRNANECAPGWGRAVWGPNDALLGYSCFNNANGT
jgi:hypothetical protein